MKHGMKSRGKRNCIFYNRLNSAIFHKNWMIEKRSYAEKRVIECYEHKRPKAVYAKYGATTIIRRLPKVKGIMRGTRFK